MANFESALNHYLQLPLCGIAIKVLQPEGNMKRKEHVTGEDGRPKGQRVEAESKDEAFNEDLLRLYYGMLSASIVCELHVTWKILSQPAFSRIKRCFIGSRTDKVLCCLHAVAAIVSRGFMITRP